MSLLPGKYTYSDVGGEKVDYAPIVDPTTDRSSDEVNTVFAASAQMSRTALRFYARFSTNNVGDGYLAEANSWDAVWKGKTGTNPIIANTATGTYTVTLPETILDERNNVQTVSFICGWANFEGDSLLIPQVSVTAGNVLTIHFFNSSGTLTDPDTQSFSVFAI